MRANPCCLTGKAGGVTVLQPSRYGPARTMSEDSRSSTASPPRGSPRVISIGGGPGGAGKSLLAVNLGRVPGPARPQRGGGRRGSGGRGLHTLLGIDPKRRPTSEADEDQKSEPIPTSIPGLVLMPPVYDPGGALLRVGQEGALARQGARSAGRLRAARPRRRHLHTTLDLFAASDVGVCVTVPEPPAIESTYRFLRALFVRQMRRSLAKERYKLRLVERAMKDLPPLPTPLEVIAALERYDRVIAALAVTQLGRLHARLVVSQTRVRSDLDLGPAMRALAGRYLGIDLDYIGYVEHDDAVWLTVRRKKPLLIDSPASKGARNVERIARRVLALATAVREGRVSEARLPPPAENLTLLRGARCLARRIRRRDSPRDRSASATFSARAACR